MSTLTNIILGGACVAGTTTLITTGAFAILSWVDERQNPGGYKGGELGCFVMACLFPAAITVALAGLAGFVWLVETIIGWLS